MTDVQRNGLVDYGRFLAALGIVWFHVVAPGTRVAHLAVPVFLIFLLLPYGDDLRTRTKRYLLPFLIWSIVFAVLNTVMALKFRSQPFDWWEWHMILAGTSLHLWLLPFVFLAATFARWFQHPLASIGAALLAATLIALNGTPDPIPFGQWAFGLIPVLVGIGYFSWGWRLAVTILGGSSLILFLGPSSPDNITILFGTGIALLILANPVPTTPVSDWFGRLAMWIFLAHPVVIMVGQTLRITWVELALFSLVGSVIMALMIETVAQASRRGQLSL